MYFTGDNTGMGYNFQRPQDMNCPCEVCHCDKPRRRKRKRYQYQAPETYEPPKFEPCVHRYFKTEPVARECLTREEYMDMLATPNKHPWLGEADGDSPELNGKKSKKKKHGRRHEEESAKQELRCMDFSFAEEFINDMWDVMSPDVTDRLIDFLVTEFGMTVEEAEDFIDCKSSVGKPTPCVKKQSKAIVSLGPKHKWVKKFSEVFANRIEQYIVSMLMARKSPRIKRIAERMLNDMCEITGNKTSLQYPKTKTEKTMVLIATRLAFWAEDIMKDLDKPRKERPLAAEEEESEKEEEPEEREREEEEEEEEKEKEKEKVPPKEETKPEDEGTEKPVSEEKLDEAPSEEKPKIEEEAPTEEEKPAVEQAAEEEKPTEDVVEEKEKPPAAEEKPGEEEKLEEEVKPAEEDAIKEDKPAEEVVEKEKPPDEEVLKPEEEKPIEGAETEAVAPVEEVKEEPAPAPAEEEVPVEEEKPERTEDEEVKPGIEEQPEEEEVEEEKLTEDKVGEEPIEEQLPEEEVEPKEIEGEEVISEKVSEKSLPKPVPKKSPIAIPRKPAIPAFEVRAKTGSTLQIQKLSSGTVVEQTAQARGVPVPPRRKVPASESPLNLKSAEEWVDWATNIASMAEEWGKWLEGRFTDAEKQLSEKRKRSDWKAWMDQARNEALKWRVEEERIKDEGERWGKKLDKSKEQSEKIVKTTDLS